MYCKFNCTRLLDVFRIVWYNSIMISFSKIKITIFNIHQLLILHPFSVWIKVHQENFLRNWYYVNHILGKRERKSDSAATNIYR